MACRPLLNLHLVSLAVTVAYVSLDKLLITPVHMAKQPYILGEACDLRVSVTLSLCLRQSAVMYVRDCLPISETTMVLHHHWLEHRVILSKAALAAAG